MNYLILFLILCLFIGVWSPTKAKRGWIVGVLAVVLVLFFLVSPTHM